MLREIDPVRQIENEPIRRWFTSSFFDLIVWLGDSGDPSGFQLCYNKGRAERALTWRHPNHYSHMAVDDGEGRAFRHKATPILVADGCFDATAITERFRLECAFVPADVANLVIAVLNEYPRHNP